MLAKSLRTYLEEHGVDFTLSPHIPTYTASETAQACHISGKKLAKVVVVKIDGKLAIALIPANEHLDLSRLEQITKAKSVTLAHEYEFSQRFADCEVGAMPPFGDLWNMDVFMSKEFNNIDILAFNAGNHSEIMSLRNQDFKRLSHPILF